ncbi:MAG: hypothetical protein SP1CHLAM54_07600 [Chlamydiia bacterium]|nr:hypothetical protein [Chlamydiia bacterium]MCH9615666.1 hypothetical protein [Chlamydiia bacterium]MCH9628931.1 hypothetical protein [Chlamydiia bacterium]
MIAVDFRNQANALLNEVRGARDLSEPELASRVDALWQACPRGDNEARTLALRVALGGSPLTPALATFVRQTALHHSLRSVGGRLREYDGAIPYQDADGNPQHVRFSDLTLVQEGGVTSYKLHGVTLFKTNGNGRLTEDYCITDRGIVQHNIYTDGLIAYRHDNAANWNNNYVLEVKTILSNEQGEDGLGNCFGQHTYFVLKNTNGECFAIGKYGQFEPELRPWYSYISPGGRMPGRMMCPDEYVQRRPTHHNFRDFDIVLSATQYQRVFDRFNREAGDGHLSFSLCRHNCESWVTDVLSRELGVEINPEVPVTDYFFGILPTWISKPCSFVKAWTYNLMPGFIQKACDVVTFPVRYLASVFCGAVAYALCYINWEGFAGGDFAWYELFTMSMSIHHPVAVRRELARIMPEGNMDISAR